MDMKKVHGKIKAQILHVLLTLPTPPETTWLLKNLNLTLKPIVKKDLLSLLMKACSLGSVKNGEKIVYYHKPNG